MKRLFLSGALFALAALLVYSCSSPTDVSAGRKVTEEPTTISVPKSIDLGTLPPSSKPNTFVMEIRNTSATHSVKVTGIAFRDGTKGFQLLYLSTDLPITLGPRGSNNETMTVTVRFTGTAIGEYQDELIVNNDPALTCKMTAMVVNPPAIITSNVDFGSLSLGLFTKEIRDIIITNNGDAPATIMTAAIQGADAVNFLLNSPAMPFMIAAGESAEIMAIFDPHGGNGQAGQYTATINFEIDYSGTGTVDNISVLTGTAVP